MQRKQLWMLMIVCLYAGCVARPASETQAVASRVLHERPSGAICKLPQMSYCEVEVTGKKNCICVSREDVFGPH
jgi:hypothetical protein